MSARQIVTWLIPPSAPLVAAPLVMTIGWLENAWFVVTFLVVAVLLLEAWRRAAFRLRPGLGAIKRKDIDPNTERRSVRWLIAILATFFFIGVGPMLALLCIPSARTDVGWFYAIYLFSWSTIIQFGVMHLVAHQLLLHASRDPSTLQKSAT